MIEKTFCHISGISENCEKNLWVNGIDSWNIFFEKHTKIKFLPKSKLDKIKTELFFSKEELIKNNLKYFYSKLPQKEHYRLINRGKIAYVDIETTGLSKYSDIITLIGIFDGDNVKIFINGKNLEDAYLELEKYDIIVTFNGKTFDLPFIEHHAKKRYEVLHLDLRYMLKEFNLAGGLKKIEKDLGIIRNDEIANVDGFEAVRLWRKYKNGDEKSLEKLIKYNTEDIVNLKFILNWYVEKKMAISNNINLKNIDFENE